MKLPFWLLIVFTNPESYQVSSITQFQTADQCVAAKAVIERKLTELKSQFNKYDEKTVVLCEMIAKR